MNDLFDFSNLVLSSTSSIDFILGLIFLSLITFFLRWVFINYSRSVSNKKIIANLLPVFGISIFLIVITIKSSIVLSLGLVGALSIIRFRTAIKEPEQIIYFLFTTAIAISTAAGSYFFPLLTTFLLLTYLKFLRKKQTNDIYSINDQLVITGIDIQNNIILELVKILNENHVDVELQSLSTVNNQSTLVLKLSNFNIQMLDLVKNFFKNKNILIEELQFFSSPE